MLYPPILASTQEVFTPSTGDLVINFSLASITAPSDIKHIGILVVKQNNNKSIANTTRYPDGVIYKNYTEGMTSVTINTTDDLGETWELGCLYKIQLRFGKNTLWTSNFATWHATQVEENAFSEWSTAMIVKPITKPSLTLAANGTVIEDSPTTITTIVSLIPTFQGTTDYNNRANEKEKEEKFCFELYQGTNLIETTGWQLHTGNEDIGYFKTMLRNQGTYKIRYRTLSTNGYELDSNYINFIAVQTSIEVLEHISIALTRFSTNPDSEKKEEEDKEFLAQEKVYRVENGCVRIYIQSDSTDLVNGNFVIVRANKADEYRRYEDLYYLNYIGEELSDQKLCYIDYTIESGVDYIYAIQQIKSEDIRTQIAAASPQVRVHYEYGFLCRGNRQLRLTFNQKMSSFKHTTLRVKQDTLGDKFPHLIQNGDAYYAEFPVTGLISYQGNTDGFFKWPSNDSEDRFDDRGGKRDFVSENHAATSQPALSDHKTQYDFNDSEYAYTDDKIASEGFRTHTRPVINNENATTTTSFGATEVDYTISTDLTDKNIYVERRFRESVEEFLNNFEYKLYKSPTEGTIIVNLMNITMQPVEDLGRMLYEFTATAYEMADYSIENLDTYGIIDRGSMEELSKQEITKETFGQVYYFPNDSETTWEQIEDQQNVSASDIYSYELQSVTNFWLEPYPTAGLIEIANFGGNDYVSNVQDTIIQVHVAIDGGSTETIYVTPRKIYTLSENITNLWIDSSCQTPMLVNYTCIVKLVYHGEVSQVGQTKIINDFGQIIIDDNATTNIRNAIRESIKARIEEEYDTTLIGIGDVWKDNEDNDYKINQLSLVDMTIPNTGANGTTGPIIVTIDGEEITMGQSIYNSTPLGFDSNRLYYILETGQGYQIMLNQPVPYAMVNFDYILEIRLISTSEV